MSQFDHVRFVFQMPDGSAGPNYQSKSLRYMMDMAEYEVNDEGRLLRTHSDFNQPLGDLAHESAILIDGDKGSYELVFVKGTLNKVHCFQTGKTVPYLVLPKVGERTGPATPSQQMPNHVPQELSATLNREI